MKKYFLFLISLIIIDAIFSIAINTNLAFKEKEYSQKQEIVIELREKTETLQLVTAQLSSIHRISEQATLMNMGKTEIVHIDQQVFAMR